MSGSLVPYQCGEAVAYGSDRIPVLRKTGKAVLRTGRVGHRAQKNYLFSAKLDQYNFRAVIEAERYDAVANAAADNHVRAACRIQPCIIFGEQPLIGCNQPADEGQTELAAMCMAA